MLPNSTYQCVLVLLELSSDVNECKPLAGGEGGRTVKLLLSPAALPSDVEYVGAGAFWAGGKRGTFQAGA